MNSQQVLEQAAASVGCNVDTARRMATVLASEIRERCSDLDSVAIPGFGTFVAQKHEEHIATDAAGVRTLMPPRVSVTFNAGSKLRKQL